MAYYSVSIFQWSANVALQEMWTEAEVCARINNTSAVTKTLPIILSPKTDTYHPICHCVYVLGKSSSSARD